MKCGYQYAHMVNEKKYCRDNCVLVIAIDGPSGVGKGEISRRLAKKLGWHLLDSGAVYRVLALTVIQQQVALTEIQHLVTLGKNLALKFVSDGEISRVILAGKDVSQLIREQACSDMASRLAVIGEVREALLDLQRSYRKSPGLVADGRDMGTVVFPDAQLKIFLTADVQVRAKRRFLQLQDQDINANLDNILEEIVVRDKRDQARKVAPLKPDVAAIIVDTTKLTIDEVLQEILVHVA